MQPFEASSCRVEGKNINSTVSDDLRIQKVGAVLALLPALQGWRGLSETNSISESSRATVSQTASRSGLQVARKDSERDLGSFEIVALPSYVVNSRFFEIFSKCVTE